ncbi:Homeobox-leucine zipper protein HOX33 [Dichanthelium oligosanthes]|uniref:Homeobox-leucine zipper protein HOX33 n=1 Tax=Dichanthelium oligosanthes TaxID=888268 RepID=A0A1E5VQZ5_9POAL|nr:Homeobox-leucine zipper protein HOX33 [Dichanthelium oligosanthes]
MAAVASRERLSPGAGAPQVDTGKYVRYTPEQVEALERVYSECPKPSSLRRQQLIRDCPILSNIEPKQIKVWFQNRRCREKQRKEASRLQTVNRKLSAMNKLLMEENDRLQKQVSRLVYDNGYMKNQLHSPSVATTDNSCESVVTSGQHYQQQNPAVPHPPQRDANNPAGLLAIAEETLAEFMSKATGTAVNWVQMVGMKPGPDSVGIIAVSHNCSGVAARACGLVSLEPTKVAEILKGRSSWYRDCRHVDILHVIPTGNGGTIELIYMQTYALTTLAGPRDFWTLRYTSGLDDGSLVICERSLTQSTGGPCGPNAPNFIRAEILPSGYLIRPCDGGGSMIYIVDHVDLNAKSVPEVLRPLYESPKILAQKMTAAALRHIRQIAHESSGEIPYGAGRQPAVLRTFSQRLSRGFNDAVSGFPDDGWSPFLSSDGPEDVTITVNSSPNKLVGSHVSPAPFFSAIGGGIMCAKASMLLQNVPPALLVRFLREHRSEWADPGVDAYSAASLRASPYAVPGLRAGGFMGNQVILPLARTLEHEELCSGVDENAPGACAQLVFAPIDESFADDAPLLPSGFRVIPLDDKMDMPSATRTLDLASALEVGSATGSRDSSDASGTCTTRSVLTIAFQFSFENHLRESVAAMARQYVRGVMASVQRVAMAIAPSRLGAHIQLKHPPGSPEALALSTWIGRSYRVHTGTEICWSDTEGADSPLMPFWKHSDAILSCSLKPPFMLKFANSAGFDILETTMVNIQDMPLEAVLDDEGRKALFSELPKIMQQVLVDQISVVPSSCFYLPIGGMMMKGIEGLKSGRVSSSRLQGLAYLPGGVCRSSMGRQASYEQAVAWKVVGDDGAPQGLALMLANWTFI